MEVLYFAAGIAYYYTNLLIFIIYALIFLAISRQKKIIILFGLGMLWAITHQHVIKNQNKIPVLEANDNQLKILVLSEPKMWGKKYVFDANLQKINNKKVNLLVKAFSFNAKNNFHKNDIWLIDAKVRATNKFLKSHIGWQIFIKNHGQQFLKTKSNLHDMILTKIHPFFGHTANSGIIEALLVGNSQYIEPSMWDLFRKTGTTHLMVVSGSHIALMVSIAWLGFGSIWRRIPRACLLIPAPQISAIIGIILGWLYAYICGFNVSTERAVVASSLCLLQYVINYPINPWQAWRITLWLTLLQDPHLVMFPGAILSFLCVAILLSQMNSSNKFLNLLKIQFYCLILTLPLCLLWFQYGSINSIFTNLIAIPWLDLLLPLGLLSLFLDLKFNIHSISIIQHGLDCLIFVLNFFAKYTGWLNITKNYCNLYVIGFYYIIVIYKSKRFTK